MKDTDWRESSQYMQAVAQENAAMNECVARNAQPPAAQPVAWQLYKGGELYALKHQKDERSDFYTWVPLYRQPDPRIAQLEADLAAAHAEVERLAQACEEQRAAYEKASSERDSAMAEAAALQADAERYRWLCEESFYKWDESCGVGLVVPSASNAKGALKPQCDAAIDAARGGGNG